jgi:hypothetical protein
MNFNRSTLVYTLIGASAVTGLFGYAVLMNARAVEPVKDASSAESLVTERAESASPTAPDRPHPDQPRKVIVTMPAARDGRVDPFEAPGDEPIRAFPAAADTTDLTVPPFWGKHEASPAARPVESLLPPVKTGPATSGRQVQFVEPEAKPAPPPPPVPPHVARPAAKPRPAINGYHAHLASYYSEDDARAGWKTLHRKLGSALNGMEPILSMVDIPGQGRFIRLMTGSFPKSADAAKFCGRIKPTGQYCQPIRTGPS